MDADARIDLLQVFYKKQVRQIAGVTEDVMLLVGGDSGARDSHYAGDVSRCNRFPGGPVTG